MTAEKICNLDCLHCIHQDCINDDDLMDPEQEQRDREIRRKNELCSLAGVRGTKAIKRRYVLRHPDKVLKQQQEWKKRDRANNPEKYRQKKREYYAKNREYLREKAREYYWKKRGKNGEKVHCNTDRGTGQSHTTRA